MIKRTKVNFRHLPLAKLEYLLGQLNELKPALERFHAETFRLGREHEQKLWERQRQVEANRPKVDVLREELQRLLIELESVAAEQRLTMQRIQANRRPSGWWSLLMHPGSVSWRLSRYSAETHSDILAYEAGERRIAELMNARMTISNQILEMTRIGPVSKIAAERPSKMIEIRQDKTVYRFDLADINEAELRAEISAKEDAGRKVHSRVDAIREKARAYDQKQRDQASVVKRKLRGQIDQDPFCPYCGERFSYDDAHADHIYPVSRGGFSTVVNMILVCSDCNARKGARTLRQFIKEFGLDEQSVHDRLEAHGKQF